MDLKYISKNDGYIIDRKFSDKELDVNTFKTTGRMILNQLLPQNDDKAKTKIVEYAFDNMKENVLDRFKKKYYLNDDEVVNFYFEGKLEDKSGNISYVGLDNGKLPVVETDFDMNFEVEVKITPKNFLKVQYENFKHSYFKISE